MNITVISSCISIFDIAENGNREFAKSDDPTRTARRIIIPIYVSAVVIK